MKQNRTLIIASTGTLHGEKYLSYLLPEIESYKVSTDFTEVLFIPFARPGGIDLNTYTERCAKALEPLSVGVRGLHEYENKVTAISDAKMIICGGGNTFLLVKTLYDYKLIPALRKAIFNGCPYIGTSAGANICGLTLGTTNDMPIVQPESHKTLGIVGYNINPHYLNLTHIEGFMSETRDQRLEEFCAVNDFPVVALPEGCYIKIQGEEETLLGNQNAFIFTRQGKRDIAVGTRLDLTF